MLRFVRADRSHLPQLTALWQAAFGDKKEVVEQFWKTCFDHIQVFCLLEGNALRAMACALPLSYIDPDGEIHRCPYFYAVATGEKYRGKGLCRSLMLQAEEALKQQGAALCCLVPQTEDLFRFYEKLGYQTAFSHEVLHISAKKQNQIKLRRIDAAAYENLRQMQLYGDFISYPELLLQLQKQAGEQTGAGLYRLESPENVAVAAAEKWGETLLIKEMLPLDEALAAHLAAALGCKEAVVRTMGEVKAFAMAKSLNGIPLPEKGYLGLAFD